MAIWDYHRILLMISVAFLIVTAGCNTGLDDGGNEALETETAKTLHEVEAQYQTVNARYNSADSEVRNADKKGVNVTNASTRLDSADSSLQAAQQSLVKARRLVNDSEYEQAQSTLTDVEQQLTESNQSISSAQKALEKSYRVALNRSITVVQSSYKQYQITRVFVKDASQAGADVSDLAARTDKVGDDIEQAQIAITKQKNPKRAKNLARSANSSALQIRQQAVAKAKTRIGMAEITAINAQLGTNRSRAWIEKARSSAKNGDLSATAENLEFAQDAEQLALFQGYTAAVAAEEGVQLHHLNDTLASQEQLLKRGEHPTEFTKITEQAKASRTCIRRLNIVENTTKAIEIESTWVSGVNTSHSSELYNESKEALRDGEYETACQKAAAAQANATAALEDLREQNQNKLLAFNLYLFSPGKADVRITPPPVNTVKMQTISLSYTPPSGIETKQMSFNATEFSTTSLEVTTPSREADFRVDAQSIGECGTTCRDVEATLTNVGQATARDVSVTVTVYVDKPDGEKFHQETYDIRDLRPGDSARKTDQISVSLFKANAVRSNGARAKMEIHWAGGAQTKTQKFSVS